MRESEFLKPIKNIKTFLYDELDSTNNFAKKIIKNEDLPFVISADSQIHGRGTKGRFFHSPKGSGLYISFCFNQKVELISDITSRAAVATTLALEEYIKTPKIKWVNDILYNDKKLVGILTESFVEKDEAIIIVGIGINLYPSKSMPEDLKGRIAFIWDREEDIKRQELFEKIIENLENYLIKREDFLDKYREFSAVIGKEIEVEFDFWEKVKVLDLDPSGALIVQKGEEKIKLYGESIRWTNYL